MCYEKIQEAGWWLSQESGGWRAESLHSGLGEGGTRLQSSRARAVSPEAGVLPFFLPEDLDSEELSIVRWPSWPQDPRC